MTLEELHQLTLAARLYYDEGRTQEEIARELGVSRPTISRLLQQAREEGIVHISVIDPFATDQRTAAALCRATGLAKAVVVPGHIRSRELLRKRLGFAAARYLEQELNPRDLLGVAWGRTLNAITLALRSRPFPGLTVVPLLGGLGQVNPSFQVLEITRRIAEAFSGAWRPLYVPAIVEDEGAKGVLMDSDDVRIVTSSWERMTAALIGIGAVTTSDETQILYADYLDGASRARLRAAGAVGDICLRFFDCFGTPVDDALPGVIGIELALLRATPNVIAVAGGPEKAEAILAAIRGRFVDVLVTDEATAQDVIDRSV